MTIDEAIENLINIKNKYLANYGEDSIINILIDEYDIQAIEMATQVLEQTRWIPVNKKLPKTDNKNDINSFNVLLWVKNKTYPEREAQIYLGKLRHVDSDDGSGNFWGIETKPCDWTIWGWSYFNEPEVIAWMPLPEPWKGE